MLISDLCNFIDAYIVVKGKINAAGGSNSSRKNRPLAFKNNAPFIVCISKINNILNDNAIVTGNGKIVWKHGPY